MNPKQQNKRESSPLRHNKNMAPTGYVALDPPPGFGHPRGAKAAAWALMMMMMMMMMMIVMTMVVIMMMMMVMMMMK